MASAAANPRSSPSKPAPSAASGESLRESIEAVIVAVILTLTFRTFLGENYQIPTGSMAPTLQGRHMDVVCPDCQYQYRTGASIENVEDGRAMGEVLATTCPICHFVMELDKRSNLNERSFAGDRIIVNKLSYLYSEPQRWDVFVFKYPGNPKINYIKRLVGLPGEAVKIRHGDAWVAPLADSQAQPDSAQFRIARKPPDKVESMLQLVDDTYYLPESLQRVGWPFRWGPVDRAGEPWQLQPEGTLSLEPTESLVWMGYRHLIPRDEDRMAIEQRGRPDLTGYFGQLITDYYEYNDGYPDASGPTAGWNWVGDLALEADLEVLTNGGEIHLDAVEGGIHHRCRIEVATGRAVLSLDDGQRAFRGAEGQEWKEAVAQTTLRGPGKYRVKFANVDDALYLWTNGKSVVFEPGTTFESAADQRPQWSPEEPGDLVPLRVGGRQVGLHVERLRVWRDVYYIAASHRDPDDGLSSDSDYSADWVYNIEDIFQVLSNPVKWSESDLFSRRREVTYRLGPDEFFPMGDNSPQSKDARLWSVATMEGLQPPPYVRREMLIGKAIFIYWPHSWNFPRFPFMIPNYQRIGSIR